jgi:hypothetical protein
MFEVVLVVSCSTHPERSATAAATIPIIYVYLFFIIGTHQPGQGLMDNIVG